MPCKTLVDVRFPLTEAQRSGATLIIWQPSFSFNYPYIQLGGQLSMKWKNIVPSQQQAVKLVCMPRATLDDGERKLCGSEQGCLNILPQRPVLMMLYIVSCIIMQPDRNG
jgi:hypothetical protein